MEEDFRLRKDADLTFPPEVHNSITKKAIGHFQVNIENAVKHIDHVYCCCSRFIDLLELESITDNNAVLMAVFETYILHRYNLDIYGCSDEVYKFQIQPLKLHYCQ